MTDKLKERFSRACELKQPVNWAKIVDCFQRWAAGLDIKVSAIVRIEGVEQLKEIAIEACETRTGWNELALSCPLFKTDTATRTSVASEAWNAYESVATKNVFAATRVWTTNNASQAMIRWAMMTTPEPRDLGPSAEVNMAWMSLLAMGAATPGAPAGFFEKWYPLFEAFEAGAYCFFFTDHGMSICTVPAVVRLDDQRRLHSSSGPALVWLKDVRDYYWHGVYVEPCVVDHPERITLADLEAEYRPKARLVKIERYCEVGSHLKSPRFSSMTVEELNERYKRACEMKQPIDWVKIAGGFQKWAAGMNIAAPAIVQNRRG